jgi:predicted nucleotidyltransferase
MLRSPDPHKRFDPFRDPRRGIGSRPHDAHDDSDVVLLLTLAPGISDLALSGLLTDAPELLGRRVDVVTAASLHPALRNRAFAEAPPF